MLDCLGLGIAPLDLLLQIEKYPAPGAKIDAANMTIQGGGPIPTAMVTLARLGMKPGLIAPIGNDVFGRFVRDELSKEGVNTSYLIKKNEPTPMAAGWIEKENGRRTIVLDLKIEIKPGDIVIGKLPGTRVVHLDGRYMPACLKLARWARKNGIPVIFDIGSMRNDVSALIPMTDHLVVAEDFALPFTGAKKPHIAVEKLRKLCKGTIVVTSGIKGSIGYDEGSGYVTQKAYKVKTVDTTGAGDSFHGAYIFGLLKGWGLSERLRFASAVAAIKCTKPGGRTGIPTYDQTMNFLKKKAAMYD
ncbi:MAG: PfkB family carbohydrate kinase [Candidatus Zixiibacteriota bacterium]